MSFIMQMGGIIVTIPTTGNSTLTHIHISFNALKTIPEVCDDNYIFMQ